MYIEPNTVIRLLKNCPLDNTYDHTIYFDDTEKQYAYFAGLTKYALSRQTYQRVNQSRMRYSTKPMICTTVTISCSKTRILVTSGSMLLSKAWNM